MSDDTLFLLLGLGLLALLIGSVLGWIAFFAGAGLRREIESLDRRLNAMSRDLDALRLAGIAPAGSPEAAPQAHEDHAPAASPDTTASPAPATGGASDDVLETGETPVSDQARWASGPPPIPPREPPPLGGKAAAPPAVRPDIEEALGTRWAVWVGGFALALGAVFLVRYSIEAGLLGPGARIAAGTLFAFALLAAGEWLRRTGFAEPDDETTRRAYVPGVLVAAGTIAAFATVLAAYALYGFLGPAAAFLLLALVALGTMALALLHGPAIAALGLAASYATPILVSSDDPSLTALATYLLLVTAATLGLGRLRGWRWLAITAVSGALLWSLVIVAAAAGSPFDGLIAALYVAASLAMAFYVFVASIHAADPAEASGSHDRVAVLVLAAFILPILFHLAVFSTSPDGVALLVGTGALFVASAYAVPAVRGLALAAVGLVLVGFTSFDVAILDLQGRPLDPSGLAEILAAPSAHRLLGAAVLLGLLFGVFGLLAALGSAARTMLAVSATAIPLGLLVIAYLRIADFEVSLAFAAAALLLAAWFGAAVETLVRRLPESEPGSGEAVSVFAIATVAALAAGLAIGLEKGMLTIALSLVVPAIAWIERWRPVAGLRPVAAVTVAIVGVRVGLDPAIVGDDLGATPVFNWLLYGYGVPAAAFAAAAWRFADRAYDGFVAFIEAAAVVFTTLTVVMLIHHAMNGGDVFAPVSGLAEQGLLTAALLSVSIGLQWLARRRPGPVFAWGTELIGGLGLLAAALGLGFVHNPLVSGEWIDGGAFDAALFLGYLVPAALAGLAAAVARGRPGGAARYVVMAAWFSGGLVFVWLTLAIRASWHVGDLSAGGVDEAELYVYSAAWLVFAILTLVAGVLAGARSLRMVATALVMLVVGKVFLLDSAGLTGALRALSFIGLGLVLVAVGLAYQKVLRRAPT